MRNPVPILRADREPSPLGTQTRFLKSPRPGCSSFGLLGVEGVEFFLFLWLLSKLPHLSLTLPPTGGISTLHISSKSTEPSNTGFGYPSVSLLELQAKRTGLEEYSFSTGLGWIHYSLLDLYPLEESFLNSSWRITAQLDPKLTFWWPFALHSSTDSPYTLRTTDWPQILCALVHVLCFAPNYFLNLKCPPFLWQKFHSPFLVHLKCHLYHRATLYPIPLPSTKSGFSHALSFHSICLCLTSFKKHSASFVVTHYRQLSFACFPLDCFLKVHTMSCPYFQCLCP